MTAPRTEGWLHRGPRPFLMWLAVAACVLVLAFFVGVGVAVLTAFQRAAEEGRPVPDMSGGIGAIAPALAVLLPALAQFFQVFNQRHVERMDQQARGSAPGLPFDPSPPSGPPPDVLGPRPWENQQ